MHNLRLEEHQFAKVCLEKMQANSMLSMKLALKMLRKAVKLDFKGALQMELNVAFRKMVRRTDLKSAR